MKLDMKKWIARVLAVAGIILCITAVALINKSERKAEKAKYIFLFIGDGMGFPTISMTEAYMSYKAGKFGVETLTFTKFPCMGISSTYSANSYITCSAAAGTAIATGHKTDNGRLGTSPDGTPLRAFTHDLKEDGYKVGIISNAPVNHATPACFYSSPEHRGAYVEIIRSIPETGIEFLSGSGIKGYYPADGGEDSETFLKKNGYSVYWGRDEYENRNHDDEKIILCQAHNKGKEAKEYFVDGYEREDALRLPEIFKACLDFLGDEEPFFIMCEGGMIDWVAHSNNTIPTALHVQEMHDAIKLAYEFYLQHPDETLIVVTSDHDTGGPSMGFGNEWMGDQLHWEVLDSAWNAAGGRNTLDEAENKKLNESAFIGWPTTHHTGADVPVYAIGKGAERFCGKMDNTDFKTKILAE